MFELREVLELDLRSCATTSRTCNHGAVLAHRAGRRCVVYGVRAAVLASHKQIDTFSFLFALARFAPPSLFFRPSEIASLSVA